MKLLMRAERGERRAAAVEEEMTEMVRLGLGLGVGVEEMTEVVRPG